jgi:hypothetical protein
MIQHPKPFPPGDPLLQGFQLVVFELLDLPAPPADQVIVVLPLGAGFESGRAFSEPSGGGPPAFRQEAQGAVHRGISDPRVHPADPPVKLVNRQVRPGLPEGADDFVPLASGFEALFAQELAEGVFGESFHTVILILKFIIKIPEKGKAVNK